MPYLALFPVSKGGLNISLVIGLGFSGPRGRVRDALSDSPSSLHTVDVFSREWVFPDLVLLS